MTRPLRDLLFCLLLAPLAGPGSPARADPASATEPADQVYIVQMRQPPAIAAARSGGILRRLTTRGRFDARSEAVRSYAARLVEDHDRLLAEIGAADAKVYSYRLAFNGFAAALSATQASKLAGHPSVAGVWQDRIRHLKSNASAGFMGLNTAGEGLRASLGLKGEGVVIGIIDSGITPGHPSFADKVEKKKPRLCRSEWAQNSLLGAWLCARFRNPRYTSVYPRPVDWRGRCEPGDGFTASACNNKLIGARWYVDGFLAFYGQPDSNESLSARDADGHGTHIASVAAGNSVQASLGGTSVARIAGIAPRARIAVYKACWLEPGATRASCALTDLQRAIEDAVADGVDIINYSVGTTEGGPADPDSLALLEASNAGVLAVVAAGNGGPADSTIESPGSAPWVLTVAASSRAGQRFDEVLRATAPATAAGDFTAKEAAFTPALRTTGAVAGRLVTAADGTGTGNDACETLVNGAEISGRVALIRRGSCTFQEKISHAEAAGAAAVVVYNDSGAPIIMTGERGGVGIPALMIGSSDGEFLGQRLAAGDAVEVRLEKGQLATRNDPGNVMYGPSARGPDPISFDILKPDVTAPGVDILGAQTRRVANGVRGEDYQYLSGTSMAVPQVAGVAALLKEAHPQWSPAAIRSALVTTARQDVLAADGVTAAGPFDFGGGHIVPNRAIAPGLVYEADRDDYYAFACGTGLSVDIDGLTDATCADLVAAGYSTAIDELNLPSLSLGDLVSERSVRRRVTNVGEAAVYQALVSAPPGVGMSVSPPSLALGAGETGDFTVTFTNLGQAERLDSWGFGALTWTAGSQQVRSPVAVRTAPLAVPAVVGGSGITGETAFDVEFGYNGSYHASAAGLAAPIMVSGLVLDDPLDFYSIIADDSALPDHIRRYRISVPEGTLYLRVALSATDPDSASDIDLYMLCPGEECPGGYAALASNGINTSDEAIDLLQPEAGEYVVDVHGYAADPVAGTAFELRAWTVSGDNGTGNLAVATSAAATVGGSATVSLSWEDLEPGEVYLGIISHDDGERELAQTLLEVVTE